MLATIAGNGVRALIVETASRFARDLIVQETGFAYLRDLGIRLIGADDPDAFTDADRDPGPAGAWRGGAIPESEPGRQS
jgi:hypothetical protein